MRWIDMHCDTLSEIAKQMKTDENTKESLERNHLSVDYIHLSRPGLDCLIQKNDSKTKPVWKTCVQP